MFAKILELCYSVHMSTEKANLIKKPIGSKRFADIALLDETIFHAKDLANLWGIYNKNTLYKTLSRYEYSGLIHRIYNGLYSIGDIKDVNPYLIGVKVLHGHAYVSCESILYDKGIINQKPRDITLVSATSKRFTIREQKFRSRKLQNKFLFNNVGIEIVGGIMIASTERAVADMIYFSPKKYLDAYNSKLIDWNKVNEIADEIGYNIKIPINI